MSDSAAGSEPAAAAASGDTTPRPAGLLRCHACGACGNVRVCLGCHEVYYCNRVCHRLFSFFSVDLTLHLCVSFIDVCVL